MREEGVQGPVVGLGLDWSWEFIPVTRGKVRKYEYAFCSLFAGKYKFIPNWRDGSVCLGGRYCLWLTLNCMKVKMLVSQSCPTLCNPMDCSLPGSPVHGISQARILRVGCHFLLQGIFLTQGLNLHLLSSQAIIFTTAPPGKPLLPYLKQQCVCQFLL